MPRITVGVPVCNGGDMMETCLQSLRDQDYEDVEFVLSDNASDDGTLAVMNRFAEADPRFRVIARDRRVPAIDNFKDLLQGQRQRVFLLARA